MRDITDSDIEYDLREINTSISVDEALSNGVSRVRDESEYQIVSQLWRGSCSRREYPPYAGLLFPSVAHGPALWQDEGVCSPSDRNAWASKHMQVTDASGSGSKNIKIKNIFLKNKGVSIYVLRIIIERCVASYSSSFALQLQFHLMETWLLAG